MTGRAGLLEQLERIGKYRRSATPLSMEELESWYGYVLYRCRLGGNPARGRLSVHEPRDRAQILIDGREVGTLFRNDHDLSVPLELPPEGVQLDILVENTGRHNYGAWLEDNRKGITHGVKFDHQYVFGWDIYALPMNNIDLLQFGSAGSLLGPTFFQGDFEVDVPADTFVRIPGTKGVCWINGFNLGRYWSVGPQRALYVPAPLLRPGRNNVVIFEQHRLFEPIVNFEDHPDLG